MCLGHLSFNCAFTYMKYFKKYVKTFFRYAFQQFERPNILLATVYDFNWEEIV